MSSEQKEMQMVDKLTCAVRLINAMKETHPISVVKNALEILEFGQITTKELLDYIEAHQ